MLQRGSLLLERSHTLWTMASYNIIHQHENNTTVWPHFLQNDDPPPKSPFETRLIKLSLDSLAGLTVKESAKIARTPLSLDSSGRIDTHFLRFTSLDHPRETQIDTPRNSALRGDRFEVDLQLSRSSGRLTHMLFRVFPHLGVA